jgi:outer membrane receptor protein involved in Fe transport
VVAGLDLRDRRRTGLLILAGGRASRRRLRFPNSSFKVYEMKKSGSLRCPLLESSALFAVLMAMAPSTPVAAGQAPPEQPTEEVIVRGLFIPDVVRETSEVATVLLPEDLTRQGDDNAAQALTRLSGLSIVGGRFVYVRGLGERYSSALLNGSPLPSPEPLQRVVPLDLFPSNVLTGALVQKSYSPQYSGEFGGGVINLQTATVPNERFFSMTLSGGGSIDTTFSPGLGYFGSKTDWTGFDDGTRDVPDLLSSAIRENRGRITEGNFTPQELQNIGHDFVNAPLNLMQNLGQVAPNFKVEASGGDRFTFGWGSLGAILVAGYDNSWHTRRGVQEEGLVTSAGDITPVTHYDYTSTRNDILLHGLFGLGLEWGNNEIRMTNLYVRSVTKEARSRAGFDNGASADVRDDNTEWFARELADTQLSGSTVLGNVELDGRASYAVTSRDAPYEKGIRYRLVGNDYLHSSTSDSNYTRFGNVNDKLLSGGIDAHYSLPLSMVRDAKFSVGYAYSDNRRSAEQREFRFQASNVSLPLDVQKERIDFLLSDVNIRPDALILRETTGGQGAAAYRADLMVNGVYGQIDAEVIPLVRVAAGLRYEYASESVSLVDLFGGAPPASPDPIKKGYVLPAGSVTWNFYEDMQLRLSASKTIARPQFRELAPQPYYDPDTDRVYSGNPFLTDSELLNVDSRVEWYFAPNQLLAIGAFFKDIDKPVEQVINETGSTQQTTFLNAPRAKLYGAEIEVRKFWSMPTGMGYLSQVGLFTSGNYTYGKSSVEASGSDEVFPASLHGGSAPAAIYVKDGDRLQGQSEHLVNLQFGAEDDALGWQATFLVNYASDRISNRGRPGFPDLIVEPGVTLDFTFNKTWVNSVGVETVLGFEARNLLATNYNEFQKLGTGTVDVNRYDIGQSFSISLKRRY